MVDSRVLIYIFGRDDEIDHLGFRLNIEWAKYRDQIQMCFCSWSHDAAPNMKLEN